MSAPLSWLLCTADASSSGLDGAFPSPMSQETHGESRFSQGPYAIAGSSNPLHPHTKRCIRICATTELVNKTSIRSVDHLLIACLRFIPPVLNRNKSNIKNSENTTLFLVSCFQYILSAIVLSVGPPFRQSMASNCECTYPPSRRLALIGHQCRLLLLSSWLSFFPLTCCSIQPYGWPLLCN